MIPHAALHGLALFRGQDIGHHLPTVFYEVFHGLKRKRESAVLKKKDGRARAVFFLGYTPSFQIEIHTNKQ